MAGLDEDDDIQEEEEDFEDIDGSELNKRKLIMILLPLLLVIGATVGVYFSGIADSIFAGEDAQKEEQVAQDGNQEAVEVDSGEIETVFYDLPEMIVNLNTRTRKRGHLMKIRVSLELEDGADIEDVEKKMPRIIDSFLVHTRELKPEELDGSSGIYRLREELLRRVGKTLDPIKVYDVLFKQFEIQ